MSTALGDKPTASATKNKDASGNCRKKKLVASRRSYERQNPENQHLYLKPFHSDPTNSSSCGHLNLAREMSYKYKYKPGRVPESDKSQSNIKFEHGESNEDKPEKLHQQLKRQLAIAGNNDPRAAPTYNVNYNAESHCPDMAEASNDSLVNQVTMIDVSTCSTRNNHTDTTQRLDTDSSLSHISHLDQTKPQLTQRPVFSDAQQFLAAERSGQELFTGDRFVSPVSAPVTSRVDNNIYAIRPVVFAYECTTDLQPYGQFSARPMFPRMMPPRFPPMFVRQPRSYLPQNVEMRPPAIRTPRRFLRR